MDNNLIIFLMLAVAFVFCDLNDVNDNNEPPRRIKRQNNYPGAVCRRRVNTSRFIAYAGRYGQILCDAETNGGGYIVIMKRYNGKLSFNRNWKAFSDGFGNVAAEFWMGHFNVFYLTVYAAFYLRIEMRYKGKDYFVEYSEFKINAEKYEYRMHYYSFLRGNTNNSLAYHNYTKFSTFDRDNAVKQNKFKFSCVENAHVGWWWKLCQECLLFGNWKSTSYGMGVNWKAITGYNESLDYVEMKIQEDTRAE